MTSPPLPHPGWKHVTFGELCLPDRGLQTGPFGSQLHAFEYTDTGVPVVMPKDIVSGRISTQNIARILPARAAELRAHWLQPGDIVLARRGDIGRCAIVTPSESGFVCGSGSMRARLTPDVYPEFIIYLLGMGDTVTRLNASAVGQTMLNLSTSALAALPLTIPPLPEQRKIAAILKTWDEAIALTEHRIAAGQQRKQGLMQRLLTGQVRFTEYAMSQTSRQTDYGQIPSDWRVVPLSELVTPISRPEAVMPDKTYHLIGVKWYVAGAHIHETVSGANLKVPSLSRVEANDIVYNKMWTTKAAFAVARDEHAGTYGTGEYPQFRAHEDLLDVNFLGHLYHLPRFQHAAASLCRGTTGRARLNPSDFLKLEIPLPLLKEQRRIAEVLSACDRELDLLARKRDALQRQKRGLMQQLLTGRVRVGGLDHGGAK